MDQPGLTVVIASMRAPSISAPAGDSVTGQAGQADLARLQEDSRVAFYLNGV